MIITKIILYTNCKLPHFGAVFLFLNLQKFEFLLNITPFHSGTPPISLPIGSS